MIKRLQYTNIRYYRRYYRLISIAILIMMTVLTGSVVTGDSVRGTLTDRVEERLGDCETIITSGTGFLNDDILQATPHLFQDAKAYLIMDGYVSCEGRMIPVYVWGTDDEELIEGESFINETLAQQINEEDFVLHLPSHSLVPSGTLFVTQAYSTQLRLHVKGVKTSREGGNMLLHNEQIRPMNVFMSRKELAEKMEIQGKINLIMSRHRITEAEVASCWHPTHSGIIQKEDTITSERIFLPASIVDALQPERLLSAYLVNSIDRIPDNTSISVDNTFSKDSVFRSDTASIPYSFVTAATSVAGIELQADEAILSDYAAERLHVSKGDSVSMTYFITHNLKSLHTRSHHFFVRDIVPLSTFELDTLLTAEFPGLSNVERCSDWDSDLPIDMERIEKEDEDFWYAHKQTPKAVVAYSAVKDDWSTPFGVATALCVKDAAKSMLSLSPNMCGVVVVHPREASLYAAQHGTDFTGLFLALGAFIIMAAILLMQSPLLEMLMQRQTEIQLYSRLGFSRHRVIRILLHEQLRVLPWAVLLGTLCGLGYAALMLFLLGNVWSGATHTEGFTLHVQVLSVVFTYVIGLLLCLLTSWYTIHTFLKDKKTKAKKSHSCIQSVLGILGLIATLLLFICNMMWWHSLLVFVSCGFLWILNTAILVMCAISYKASSKDRFSRMALLWKSIHASRKQWLLSYWSMAMGVFTVLSVGLNRPDFSHAIDDTSLTSGCQLWCDLRIPLEYDLNNPDVRRKLSLETLPDSTFFVQCLRHTEDEASCLNLNKVSTPTVMAFVEEGLTVPDDTGAVHHGLLSTVHGPWSEMSAQGYGVFLDKESLIWSVMKEVGDTICYTASDGRKVLLPILDSYPTGVFHGNALMSAKLFRQLWPEESGTKVLLVRTQPGKEKEVAELLEIALSQYGIRISTTTERLEAFFTVTNTYLSIFFILGGLGMLVGIFSLIITLRKSLLSRKQQMQVLRRLGFTDEVLHALLFRECFVIPVSAIVLGATGSLISISANMGGAGWSTWCMALLFLAVLVLLIYIGIKKIIYKL